jgi:hypothetical protein
VFPTGPRSCLDAAFEVAGHHLGSGCVRECGAVRLAVEREGRPSCRTGMAGQGERVVVVVEVVVEVGLSGEIDRAELRSSHVTSISFNGTSEYYRRRCRKFTKIFI